MEKIIKKVLGLLKMIPEEYRSIILPVLLEQEICEIRRQEKKSDRLEIRKEREDDRQKRLREKLDYKKKESKV